MQHEHHRVPVTALLNWEKEHVLAGVGPRLKIYDRRQRVLYLDALVFKSQAIHGILVCDKRDDESIVLVWGGRQLCAVALKQSSDGDRITLQRGTPVEAEDWILDAACFADNDWECINVALVTAHNALAISRIATNSLDTTIRPLVPGSNCILYSANIVCLSDGRLLIASGTAFGDVIVWTCLLKEAEDASNAECETHYVFSAHQGSVFGVTIASPDQSAMFGGRHRVLASCSDDRTIRIWDISDLSGQCPSLSELQRQTGFGTDGAAEPTGPRCLATKMGHISRIWRVAFVNAAHADQQVSNGKSPAVTSFGEDASAITWWIEESEAGHDTPFSLHQIKVSRAHTGKNIWSVAHSNNSELVTGGADGALAVSASPHEDPGLLQREIDGQLISPEGVRDSFKSYNFTSNNELVAITERGRVLQISFSGDNHSLVSSLPATSALVNYSLSASVGDNVILAGKTSVFHYNQTNQNSELIMETDKKISGLFVEDLTASRSLQSKSIGILITTVGSTTARLLELDRSLRTERSHAFDAQTNHAFNITVPQDFVVTSFAYSTLGDRVCILIGSRAGSIAAYLLPSPRAESTIAASVVFKGVHAMEAVTSIKICSKLTSDNVASTETAIYSTGRDGTYAAHELIIADEGDVRLQTLHQLLLPFGPNIEGLSIEDNGNVWVWGFRSKHFVVYDVTRQEEIMTVECGGAHRNWALRRMKHGGIFVWTKASRVFWAEQNFPPFQLINTGGHGREIKCVSIAPGASGIIATGAEDTNIKLSIYKNGQIRCLHTLQKHNTGIQHLQWSPDGQYLFSSGGFEEFFVWKISADRKVRGIEVGVVCESAHPNSGTSDLRIMNFDVRGRAGEFEITMAYSNSDLKRWRYSNKSWRAVAHGSYLTTCFTQCLRLSDNETTLITASTDGHIVRWTSSKGVDADEESTSVWSSRQRIHQNAILALDIYHLADGSTLLFTGGDDNAVGITRIAPSDGSPDDEAAEAPAHVTTEKVAPTVLLLTRAHAAAVTGLSVIGVRGNYVRFVTAGLDQRLKLWEIQIDASQTGIACVTGVRRVLTKEMSDFTAVADVSGLGLLQLPRHYSADAATEEVGNCKEETLDIGVIICGVGMDIWRLDDW